MADHAATRWVAGAPSTKQESLGEKTHFNGFRYTKGSIMLKNEKKRVSAPKKSLSMSCYSLYGRSGHLVLCVLARSALVFVLHCKWRKQQREPSHAQCHITH